jgi:hypothetical protein
MTQLPLSLSLLRDALGVQLDHFAPGAKAKLESSVPYYMRTPLFVGAVVTVASWTIAIVALIFGTPDTSLWLYGFGHALTGIMAGGIFAALMMVEDLLNVDPTPGMAWAGAIAGGAVVSIMGLLAPSFDLTVGFIAVLAPLAAGAMAFLVVPLINKATLWGNYRMFGNRTPWIYPGIISYER